MRTSTLTWRVSSCLLLLTACSDDGDPTSSSTGSETTSSTSGSATSGSSSSSASGTAVSASSGTGQPGCGSNPPCPETEICDDGACRLPVSCRELNDASPSLPSAAYEIDVDGAEPLEPFSIYCDMDEDDALGAGWTLFLVSLDGPTSEAVSTEQNEVHAGLLVSASPASSAKLKDSVIQALIQTQPTGEAIMRFEPLDPPNSNTRLYLRGGDLEWTLATGSNYYLASLEARLDDSTQWEAGLICKGRSSMQGSLDGCGISAGTSDYCFSRYMGEGACVIALNDSAHFTLAGGAWTPSGGRDIRLWIR